jgi:hypothetical protein
MNVTIDAFGSPFTPRIFRYYLKIARHTPYAGLFQGGLQQRRRKAQRPNLPSQLADLPNAVTSTEHSPSIRRLPLAAASTLVVFETSSRQ